MPAKPYNYPNNYTPWCLFVCYIGILHIRPMWYNYFCPLKGKYRLLSKHMISFYK